MPFLFHPLGDKVAIKRDEAKEKTKLGIYIPDTGQKKPSSGEVLECGKGLYVHATTADGNVFFHREPIEVQPGMRVMFVTYAGMEVQDSRGTLTVIPAKDILGIVEETDAKP